MHIQKKAIRSHIIKIRVNHDEMTAIKIRAGSAATAEWLRNLAMDFPVDLSHRPSRHYARVTNETNPERSELVREVARIGSNLNQLTRSVNSSRYTAAPINLIMVSTQLSMIWQELNYVQQNFQPRKRQSDGDRLLTVANRCDEEVKNTASSSDAWGLGIDQGNY